MKDLNKQMQIQEEREFKQRQKDLMFEYYDFTYDKHMDNLELEFEYEDFTEMRYVAIDSCRQGRLILTSIHDYQDNNMYYENVFNIAKGNMGYVNKLYNLIPSKEINDYYIANRRNDDWFNEYSKMYNEQLHGNNARIDLVQIQELLDLGQDVCLLCFCKGYKRCHRKLISKYFRKLGYEALYK